MRIFYSLKPLSYQSGVLTAFYQRLKNADCRGVRCAANSIAVYALCNHIERHVVAFVFSMIKINAATWCLLSGLCERFDNALGSSIAPWPCCEHAACML